MECITICDNQTKSYDKYYLIYYDYMRKEF